MQTSISRLTTKQRRRSVAAFLAVGCMAAISGLLAPVRTAAQSLAEWNQLKAKCGLPSGTIYNTWVAQGAPCNQGSSTNATANAQQQLATQATMAGAKMIGEGIHDALFGKPESPEQQQLRIAAKQLNNSGVWYMRQHDYANAIVEFQKALQKTPNDATVVGNLTLARRLLDQSSHNNAAASQNSDALANILGVTPSAARQPSWDQPENLFHNIDVNFTSNTVSLENARTSSIDPANLKKDGPDSGHPLQTKEELNQAFDKAVAPDQKSQDEQKQLNSEFDKLVAPTSGAAAPVKPQPNTANAKKAGVKATAQPATKSQTPAEKP